MFAKCTCGHIKTFHQNYQDSKNCLKENCTCEEFEHASRKWKYNKRVNSKLHPFGVIRTESEAYREKIRRELYG